VTAADTRRELVNAAERLFAAERIDGPSLREISKAAGQLNTNALQYHFGQRDAVLNAILEKHAATIEPHRLGLLDQMDRSVEVDPRDVAAALVLPQAAKLDDADGGPEYLQIVAEVTARQDRFAETFALAAQARSMERWSKRAGALLPPAAVGRPLHRRFAAIRFCTGELASRAREARRRDHRLFTSHLVDLVTAVLSAPVSAETTRLIH
jgi:AcrR family transcriptional regulator